MSEKFSSGMKNPNKQSLKEWNMYKFIGITQNIMSYSITRPWIAQSIKLMINKKR